MTAEEYIKDVQAAIRSNQYARQFYFPDNKARRKTMNLRLAREVGFGLGGFSGFNDWGSLYSQLVVLFSLDTTGVCIDAREFLNECRRSASKGNLS